MVDRFGLADLESLADRWDHLVASTPGLDPFCASTDWSFSAAESFPVASAPLLTAHGDALCGMRRVRQVDGSVVLVGLDPVWGFASPVVGDPVDAAAALLARLSAERHDIALVTGQHLERAWTRMLVGGLGDRRVFVGPSQERIRADLTDGFDGWWRRRSPRFRQRLRRIERDAADAGITVVDASTTPPDALVDRIVGIERNSWKADEETGLLSSEFAAFYRRITTRLGPQRTRFRVATRDGVDLGYILGGVRGSTYRGLQLSYRADAAAHSIGHLLQLDQLRHLDAGVEVYDMGMAMDYKDRWADRSDDTISLLILP